MARQKKNKLDRKINVQSNFTNTARVFKIETRGRIIETGEICVTSSLDTLESANGTLKLMILLVSASRHFYGVKWLPISRHMSTLICRQIF